MAELSVLALRELSRTGWSPGRNLVISDAVLELRFEGHTVTRIAEEFLAEFRDLEMRIRQFPAGVSVDSFVFSPVGASSTPAANVALYEYCIGSTLTPVGLAFGEVVTLMISESGAMYGAVDATLLKVGEDPNDGINALCENRLLEDIPGVQWESED